jgi:hypothetical protein
MQHIGMHGADKPKLRTKALIRFIEFVRPDSFWPQPYSLEQAFHVFQWMVRTGKEFSKYQRSGVFDLLNKKATCCGAWNIDPIISVSDLRERFHHALLSAYGSELVSQWRKKNNICITEKKWIAFPHYTPFENSEAFGSESDLKDALNDLLTKSRGKFFNFSPNSCHPKATWIEKVFVNVTPEGFRFMARYGYEEDEGSSSWDYVLARSDAMTTPFAQTLAEAIKKLNELTAPKDEERGSAETVAG